MPDSARWSPRAPRTRWNCWASAITIWPKPNGWRRTLVLHACWRRPSCYWTSACTHLPCALCSSWKKSKPTTSPRWNCNWKRISASAIGNRCWRYSANWKNAAPSNPSICSRFATMHMRSWSNAAPAIARNCSPIGTSCRKQSGWKRSWPGWQPTHSSLRVKALSRQNLSKWAWPVNGTAHWPRYMAIAPAKIQSSNCSRPNSGCKATMATPGCCCPWAICASARSFGAKRKAIWKPASA